MRALLSLALVRMAFGAPVAVATHDSGCDVQMATATAEGGGFGLFVDEIAGPTYLYSIWIYLESNDVGGWQRDAAGGDDFGGELCGHAADTIIF
ncbi:MAG: hypothetical protein ACREN5_15195 [Gemmatimonadales bacterium]